MGLKKTNEKVMSLNSVFTYGQNKGCTVLEIINDGQCGYIQFLINEGRVELDDYAYRYLKENGCSGSICNQCQDLFGYDQSTL